MKNKILANNFRKIRKSYKRFISLMFLSLLGVGFFVGIKAASPDMLNTIDYYFDSNNVYDLEIISSMGLTEDDLSAIGDLDLVDRAIGVKSLDYVYPFNDGEKNIRITAITDINKVNLLKGKMPSNEFEIVVEERLLSENELKIGDILNIQNEYFLNDSFKIVGIVESSLFFSNNRGTTTVGDGKLDYLTYVLNDSFTTDFYSSVYVEAVGTRAEVTSSSKYLDIVSLAQDEIDGIREERENIRFDSIYSEQINYMKAMGMDIDLAGLQRPTWYIFDRTNNLGYSTFIDATESLKQIGNVFPLVFYIVAVLISLISMTRMVDEDRLEIGTLKGLGFSNYHIISNYITYSFLATTIGGLIGMIIGFNLFPRIIWSIYQTLFSIPLFICEFNLLYVSIGLLVALICICGASIITAFNSLKEKPSELMRPKAPKVGKKILLENLSSLWSHINFSNKITIRNIFRYKRRVIVTVVGISFSTALVLVGFGLKDSVTNVKNLNYDNVHVYDRMISLKSGEDISTLKEILSSNKDITSYVPCISETINLYNFDEEYVETNLVVPEYGYDINDVIKLNDINNQYKSVMMNDEDEEGIILSEKLARTLRVNVGDHVALLDETGYIGLRVIKIVENYINNYAYITKKTYYNTFGEYTPNTIFFNISDKYDDDIDKQIVLNNSVGGIVTKDSIADLIGDVLGTLNSVVVVLIISSAMLAFVILYNLANINISERRREISTLKVLGFYDDEVDAYIMRETYFVTLIGIIFGLIIGQYLSYYVISTCEPQFVMFIRHVEIISYVFAALISLVFTFIVNKITHINLKRIDMVESLKSNE